MEYGVEIAVSVEKLKSQFFDFINEKIADSENVDPYIEAFDFALKKIQE
jgi:hypothetical protein